MKLPKDLLSQKNLKKWNILDVGYTEESRPISYNHFETFTKNNSNSSFPIKYLGDHRKELRKDLKYFFPEFQSALVFLFSYKEFKKWLNKYYQDHPNALKMAGFALAFGGEDYHFILKDILEEIAKDIESNNPSLKWKLSLDIHPVLERDLAYRAGLGWFGKNSMLINREHGSYFMIGSILFSEKTDHLDTKQIEKDHCGNCKACMESCPTSAIVPQKKEILIEKCLAYYTVEVFKENQKHQAHAHLDKAFFGCDICQDVCPWNKSALKKIESINFSPKKQALLAKILHFFCEMKKNDLELFLNSLTNRGYKKEFNRTSLERIGKQGILKNLGSK